MEMLIRLNNFSVLFLFYIVIQLEKRDYEYLHVMGQEF